MPQRLRNLSAAISDACIGNGNKVAWRADCERDFWETADHHHRIVAYRGRLVRARAVVLSLEFAYIAGMAFGVTRYMRNRTLPILVFTLAAMALCGCASDEMAGRFLTTPDKYVLYNCEALATAAQGNADRQRELKALMTKAGVDGGGRLVSDMAYQPEYLQLRGLMDQLRKTAAEKNCNLSRDGSGVGRRQDERTRR